MASLLQYPKFQALDDNGDPLSGGKVNTYVPGTTTAKTTYSDLALSSPNANPVILDARGEADIYFSGEIKIVLTDSDDTSVWTFDNLQGVSQVNQNRYYVDSTEADQGVAGGGRSLKDIVDDIGGSKQATVVFEHNESGNTTTYTLTTSETISSNIELVFENGAVIDGAGTLTLDNSGQIIAGINQKIFGSSITAVFTNPGPEVSASWWGFSPDESAANNATFFNAALTACMNSTTDLYVVPGAYSCNAISYTKTTTGDFEPGITIRSGRSMSGEEGGQTAYFDFSGLSGTAYGFEFNNTASDGGQIVGMTFENIMGLGPGVAETATIGIYVHGNAGIRFLTLRNTRFEKFGTGGHIEGPNGYGLLTESLVFENNVVGLKLVNIEAGTHNMLSCLGNTRSLYLDRCNGQTFNSPIFQTASAANTYGVIIDLGNGDSWGPVFNNPYFESLQEYAFNIGFDSDMAESTGETILGMVVNGGTYSFPSTNTKLLNIHSNVADDARAMAFNNIIIVNASFDDPSSLINGGNPRATTFTLSKGQDAIFYYYDDNGNGPWKLENVIAVENPADSTSGTGEDDLTSTLIAGNSVMSGLKILAAGTKTGSNGNKTLKFYFGATSVTFHAAANNTDDWRFEATVLYNGTSAQRISWVGYDGATVRQGYNTSAEDTTGAVTVKITGECANAGDEIGQKMWLIEHLKDNF